MKQLIHIDNYESFYLDYLEGTLSAEERMAFEEFLAAHPELQVDEALIFLDDAPETMDPLEKALLKKEEIQVVSPENLEYLAIGKMEQVLSAKEEALFDAYSAKHAEARELTAAYRETRLEASPVLYPNKEDLKEKEVALVSWRLIIGVASAAALVLLFFQLGFTDNGKPSQNGTTGTVAQKHQPEQHTTPNDEQTPGNTSPSTNPVEESTTYVAQKQTPLAPSLNSGSGQKKEQKATKQEQKEGTILPVQPENSNNKTLLGDNTPQHQPTILPEMKDNKQPVAPTLNEEVNKAPSKDLASNTGSNMKNPIPVITHTLSEKTKTPVDFKTGKATETEKGGFFLKIGKFEVSHKASRKR